MVVILEGGGFIGKDEAGAGNQGPGDGQALALPAGQGTFVGASARARQAGVRQLPEESPPACGTR